MIPIPIPFFQLIPIPGNFDSDSDSSISKWLDSDSKMTKISVIPESILVPQSESPIFDAH